MKNKIERQDYNVIYNSNYITINDKRIDKTISLEEINTMIHDVEKNNKSNKKKLIVTTGENTLLTTKARERIMDLADNESYKFGIVIHDLSQRLIGNFVIHHLRNKKSIKIFTNEKKAINWISNN